MGPTKPDGTLNPPNGDVFGEMGECLKRGLSGRPSLARFVEVTYEGILSLKEQLDRIETRLARLENSVEPAGKPRLRSAARSRPGNSRRRH